MPDIVLTPYSEAKKAIWKGLRRHNRAFTGKLPWKNIAVTVQDEARIVGGVAGEAWGDWLFIQALWIDEAYRGQDHGAALIARLEAEAVAFGVSNAYVDTFSFQARGFYEKQGYRVFGTLEGYPPGESRFWLRKGLAGADSAGKARSRRRSS